MEWLIKEKVNFEYKIKYLPHLFEEHIEVLTQLVPSQRVVVFIDKVVNEIFGTNIKKKLNSAFDEIFFRPVLANEKNKNFRLLHDVLSLLDDFDPPRKSFAVIIIGGGVLCDVVGLAASLYRRGISLIRIPTTLIAQIDAAIGIKTGINYNNKKNRVGSYYHKHVTLLDPSFLSSLPSIEFISGMAEILKLALTLDENLFIDLENMGSKMIRTKMGYSYLEEIKFQAVCWHKICAKAIQLMLDRLRPNLLETRLQRVVDFGHTWSPVIELMHSPPLPHGLAVNLDMAFSCCISLVRGYLNEHDVRRIFKLMTALSLPLTDATLTLNVLKDGLRNATQHRGGNQNLPIPRSIGDYIFINDLTNHEMIQSRELLKDFSNET